MEKVDGEHTEAFGGADDGADGGGAEDAVLTDEKLLDTICSSHFDDSLNGNIVPVATITTHHEGLSFQVRKKGVEQRLEPVVQVVLFLEDLHSLSKTRGSGLLPGDGRCAHRVDFHQTK